MAHHALALGYFFLAVFCTFVSAHSFRELRIPLLVAAALALAAGVAYIPGPLTAAYRALSARLREFVSWVAKMIRQAKEPPSHRKGEDKEQGAGARS
jgi:hypothetical protein